MGNRHLLSELFSLHLTIIPQEIQFVLQKPGKAPFLRDDSPESRCDIPVI
jgi:phosphopantetheinyl transferase